MQLFSLRPPQGCALAGALQPIGPPSAVHVGWPFWEDRRGFAAMEAIALKLEAMEAALFSVGGHMIQLRKRVSLPRHGTAGRCSRRWTLGVEVFGTISQHSYCTMQP